MSLCHKKGNEASSVKMPKESIRSNEAMMQRDEKIAILQMIVCAFLWSTAGIFIKLIPWNAFVIAGWRSLIAMATVGVYLWWSKTPLRITRLSIKYGLFMCATMLCFCVANKLTTAANAIVLQFTSPAWIIILGAIFYGQKVRKMDILTAALVLFGISFFFFDSLSAGGILGNCIALISGVTFASMMLSVTGGAEDEKMGGLIAGNLFTAVIGIAFTFYYGIELSTVAITCMFCLGVFQLGLSYILYILSTKKCPPLACVLLSAVEPLLNPVWVLVFNGERPGINALIGGV
ncbi:MAG TPA: hypothetical protein DCW60_04065, partial [Sutterella sp.]|nr:hypothetical protein [Sutterella sp.]